MADSGEAVRNRIGILERIGLPRLWSPVSKMASPVRRALGNIRLSYSLVAGLRNFIFVLDIVVFTAGGFLLLEIVGGFWKVWVIAGIILGLGLTLIEVGWANTNARVVNYGIANNIFGPAFLTVIFVRSVDENWYLGIIFFTMITLHIYLNPRVGKIRRFLQKQALAIAIPLPVSVAISAYMRNDRVGILWASVFGMIFMVLIKDEEEEQCSKCNQGENTG